MSPMTGNNEYQSTLCVLRTGKPDLVITSSANSKIAKVIHIKLLPVNNPLHIAAVTKAFFQLCRYITVYINCYCSALF